MGNMGSAESSNIQPVGWNEFVELDEDDGRELVDGQLVQIEMPTLAHERVVSAIHRHLANWAAENRAGLVLASGYKIRISDERGVMPDVQFLSAETAAAAADRGLEHGRPELVVEVVSQSSRRYDRVTKLGWYASIGVPEYWVVDPDARTIERLVLQNSTYFIAQTATEGTFRPESFRGLEIALDEVWAG
jgi:Uma2 family endonuclease